ncbi:MAG TPA: glycosyltransferase [Thermoanaerobaculia bacterium]|jgi:D-inositol-3-phosphate glycosyltransferase|nr:glycosyltransferase [Thermoanaerobaculia bacterium]
MSDAGVGSRGSGVGDLHSPVSPPTPNPRPPTPARIAIVGPVYPFRAGIAYCTTRLAEELRKQYDVDVISFSRQFPKRFYPGGDDVDPTLPRAAAAFIIDVMNPLTWLRAGWRLRRCDSVIFVWWVWLFAPAYLTMIAMMRRRTPVILQCHNVGDKEPAAWKRWLTNRVLCRANVLVTHARTEANEAWKRSGGRRVVKTFLPVHELGGAIPSRAEARATLHIDDATNVALFFGHIRPFKGLDIALRAWRELRTEVLLVAAGEAWWERAEEYERLAGELGLPDRGVRFDFRFIPDSEIATYFAATDVVLAPYRIEAQSGVALTAFHFARPVIATTVGGLPEIIDGSNGILVSPEDPAALARAIDDFFANRDRAAMERAASASARKYSWPEYAAVFAALVDGR